MIRILPLLLCLSLSLPAWGQVRLATVDAIQLLQPKVSRERGDRLALTIEEMGTLYKIDPLIITGVIMLESSFRPDIEHLLFKGPSGEIGVMQINPRNSVAMNSRPEGCPRSLKGVRCQIGTGVNFLSKVRDRCPGSVWRWVGSYRTKSCLSEEEAAKTPYIQRLKAFCKQIGCQEDEL